MSESVDARPLFIVGNPRTGSTLLSTLLLQHPAVHVHGELFHPEENERRETHFLRGRRKSWFDPETDDAIMFLDEHVFGVTTDYLDRSVSVVGVKIFADHVSTGGATHLFRRIRAHYPTAAIVHMRRDDYLDVLVSLEIASRSRQWVNWSHDVQQRESVSPFTIKVERAREFFERMYRADSFFALRFAGDNYIPLHYNELVRDIPRASADLFARLGVPDHEVQAVTEKQVQVSDFELIKNMDHLVAEFTAFQSRTEV